MFLLDQLQWCILVVIFQKSHLYSHLQCQSFKNSCLFGFSLSQEENLWSFGVEIIVNYGIQVVKHYVNEYTRYAYKSYKVTLIIASDVDGSS